MSDYDAKAIEEWRDYRGHDCTDYGLSETTDDCGNCGDGPMEHDTTSFALMAKAEHERYDALRAKVSEARLTGRSSQALGYMEPEKTIARIIAILSDTHEGNS